MNNMAEKEPTPFEDETYEILRTVIEVLEEAGGNRNHLALIRGLVKSSDLSKGLTYLDLAELLGIEIDGDRGYTKKIRNWYQKSVDQLNENKLVLAHKLKEKGIERQPVLNIRQGNGSGNPSVLTVELKDLERADSGLLSDGVTTEEGQISYKVSAVNNLPVWARPMGRISLKGRRRYLYAFLPALLVLVGAVTSILLINSDLTTTQMAITHIYGGAFLYGLWRLIKPFYRLLDTRTSQAPFWMLPFKTPHALLIMRKTDADSFDREILLLEFTGKCPVCGEKVEVVEGQGEFKGRFIGRCTEAGAEHLFSFDHVSKIGVPLRSNGYYGRIVKEQ